MKKKKIYSLVSVGILLAISINLSAQPSLDWVKPAGSTGADYGYSMAVHSNGNVYTAGFFTGTVDFDPSNNNTILTADSTDIFVSKFDAAGSFQWVRRMGGNYSADAAYSVAVDASENVFITGAYKGTANFRPDGTPAVNLTAAGKVDAFVAKLNSSGDLQWAKSIGGTKEDAGYGIAIAKNGNPIVTGWFTHQADFDPDGGTTNLSAKGSSTLLSTTDIFVLKLKSTDGSYDFAKNMGGSSNDFPFSIALDASDNIYTTGGFTASSTSPADFDPGSGTANLTSTGYDIFISKLDASGNYGWSKKMGGGGDDFGNGITIDKSGNIIVTGAFQAKADFDPSTAKYEITAAGDNTVYDAFVAKLNSAGDFGWAKAMGGTADDAGLYVTTDNQKNIYTVGGFKSTADLDPGAATESYTAKGGTDVYDIYVSKLDSNGVHQWVRVFGDTQDDAGQCIVVDANNNIYVSGGFKNTVDFDPTGGTHNLTSAGDNDSFTLKLSQSVPCTKPSTPTVTVTNNCDGTSILTSSSTIGTYLWSPGGATTPSITVTSPGTYSVTITENNCTSAPGTGIAAPKSTPATPTVNVTDGCGSSTLTSSATTGTYLWSPGGATSQSINANSAGSYSVVVTENGCSSASGVGAANPLPATVPTPTVTVSDACGSSILTSSSTTGAYLWSPSGETSQSITVSSPGSYSVVVTENNCTSAAGVATANPLGTPSAPGVSDISYCQNSTASALSATGNSLLWYTAVSGGTGNSNAPTPSTTSVGQTDYYVSQTVSGCESARAKITVNITAGTVAPTVNSPVTYCQGQTANPLTATGTSLLWYTASTGGTGDSNAPTPITTSAGTVSYYVSQTQCGEGPRAKIDVVVAATPSVPTVNVNNSCGSSVLTASNYTGSLLWSTTETSASITVNTPGTYSVTQTVSGCVSSVGTGTAAPSGAPSVPSVTSPVIYCQNATATALTATGTNLNWYTTATGGTSSSTAPTPSTTTAGSQDFYVSQGATGCESARAQITVNVTATPAAPAVSTPVGYCQNSTSVPLSAAGSNLFWYTSATGGSGNATAPTPSTSSLGSTDYYVSQSSGSCESARAKITVNVTSSTTAPTVTSPVTYCKGSTASALTATGTNLLWYTSPTGGGGTSTAPVPSTTSGGSYYVSQTQCGEGPRAEIKVNIIAIPDVKVKSISVCLGDVAKLTASGASSYVWGDNSTSATYSVTPTAKGVTGYTVTGTTAGCSSSATATITTDSCGGIGIDEVSFDGTLDIYPNPNNGMFTISASGLGFGGVQVSIMNILGEIVFNNQYSSGDNIVQTIDLNNVSDGIYFVSLSNSKGTITKKIIVQ